MEFQQARARQMPIPNPTGKDGEPLCLVNQFDGPRGTLHQRNVGPLSYLITQIQGMVDRPVIDATGLSGNFEWDFRFSIQPDRPDAEAPSIYTALQEDLGLKLDARMGPQQVWVIDAVSMPTAN